MVVIKRVVGARLDFFFLHPNEAHRRTFRKDRTEGICSGRLRCTDQGQQVGHFMIVNSSARSGSCCLPASEPTLAGRGGSFPASEPLRELREPSGESSLGLPLGSELELGLRNAEGLLSASPSS